MLLLLNRKRTLHATAAGALLIWSEWKRINQNTGAILLHRVHKQTRGDMMIQLLICLSYLKHSWRWKHSNHKRAHPRICSRTFINDRQDQKCDLMRPYNFIFFLLVLLYYTKKGYIFHQDETTRPVQLKVTNELHIFIKIFWHWQNIILQSMFHLFTCFVTEWSFSASEPRVFEPINSLPFLLLFFSGFEFRPFQL